MYECQAPQCFIRIPLKEIIYRVTGRVSTVFDRVFYSLGPGARDSKRSKEKEPGFDRTGLVAGEPKKLEVFNIGGVIYAEYESLYFSLWRAQELTLFFREKEKLKKPVLDLGCGDGSFGSAVFNEIDYGVDNDPEALAASLKLKTYKKLLGDTSKIGTGTIGSVFSNSVLEHIKDLDRVLSEVSRILAPGGAFAFTVPVKQYERDLKKYYGGWYSDLMNRLSYHYNMFEPEEWQKRVEAQGLKVEKIVHYQPGWFTYRDYMLRFFSDKSLGILFPGIGKKVFRRYEKNMIDMVRRSITETASGGNIFIVAKKPDR